VGLTADTTLGRIEMSTDAIEPVDEREVLARIIMKVRYRNGRPPAWVVREADDMVDQILNAGFSKKAA